MIYVLGFMFVLLLAGLAASFLFEHFAWRRFGEDDEAE